MDKDMLQALLEDVRAGRVEVRSAVERIKDLPFIPLKMANLDTHRMLRTGVPEVVYGEGKPAAYLLDIVKTLVAHSGSVLVTRVDIDKAAPLKEAIPQGVHHPLSRTFRVGGVHSGAGKGKIAIITAGTSDAPIAEEAEVTAQFLGNEVIRIDDVGVAGLHRVASKRQQIEAASTVIVIAGMEGALASLIAGLISRPVIAVPTSVGYGASFGGLAALLGMLSSCAPGVGVVNIDNGFGAAVLASTINRV
jgi:NCAIR mutase (PurE)-related protein